jgi:hypothetical protein
MMCDKHLNTTKKFPFQIQLFQEEMRILAVTMSVTLLIRSKRVKVLLCNY